MGRRERRYELDEDAIERQIEEAIESGARALKAGGKAVARSLGNLEVIITDDDDDDDDRKKPRKLNRRARNEQREGERVPAGPRGNYGPPMPPQEIPPESRWEYRERLMKAFVSPAALFTMGGMWIGGIINLFEGEFGVFIGLLVGGAVFYVALASATFTELGEQREKKLRKLIQMGQPLPSSSGPSIHVGRSGPEAARGQAPVNAPLPEGAALYFHRLNTLIERIKARDGESESPAIEHARLDEYAKVAREYLLKYQEVEGYLVSVGGSAGARTEVASLRTQLETMNAEDPRREGIEKLLPYKEKNARILLELEQFLLRVEGKLAEQVAQLENLDSSLVRHSLGAFQQQQEFESEIWSHEVSVLNEGLEANAQGMQEELRRVGQSLV